jgi:hypothetical protein
VHLVEAGLVEDRGRVAGRGRHRRPELIQVGGAGGVGFQHGLAHVVHQLDQEQLLVHRGHRVGDQLLAYLGEPGGGQQGGQAGTDGRVAPVEADGGAVDLLQPIQGWRRGSERRVPVNRSSTATTPPGRTAAPMARSAAIGSTRRLSSSRAYAGW